MGVSKFHSPAPLPDSPSRSAALLPVRPLQSPALLQVRPLQSPALPRGKVPQSPAQTPVPLRGRPLQSAAPRRGERCNSEAAPLVLEMLVLRALRLTWCFSALPIRVSASLPRICRTYSSVFSVPTRHAPAHTVA